MVCDRGQAAAVLLLLLGSILVHAQDVAIRFETEAFTRWVDKRGFQVPKIELAENAGNGMGRGLMALTGLKEGDLIIRAPMKWVMSSENAKEHEDLAKALKLAKDLIPRGMGGEKITVALMLMYEACKQGPGGGASCELAQEESEWRPYIDVLPRNMSAPMFWSSDEVAQLKGSQVRELHESDIAEFKKDWWTASQVLRHVQRGSCCWDEERFKWAVWMINSRALTLEGIKYLIPVADMINYEEMFLRYHEVNGKWASIRVDRAIKARGGIVESYGDNGNSMYLRFFGFVPENNPADCVTLRFVSQAKDKELLAKIKVSQQVDVCLKMGQAIPNKVYGFLRAINIKGDKELEVALGVTSVAKQVSIRNERAMLRAVIAAAQKALALFPTTAAEDEAMLQKGGLSHNTVLAIKVRLNEKKILMDIGERTKSIVADTKEAKKDL